MTLDELRRAERQKYEAFRNLPNGIERQAGYAEWLIIRRELVEVEHNGERGL